MHNYLEFHSGVTSNEIIYKTDEESLRNVKYPWPIFIDLVETGLLNEAKIVYDAHKDFISHDLYSAWHLSLRGQACPYTCE